MHAYVQVAGQTVRHTRTAPSFLPLAHTNTSNVLTIQLHCNSICFPNLYGSAGVDGCIETQGNTHVVYNGSFYYQKKDSSRIIRFDLDSSKELGE